MHHFLIMIQPEKSVHGFYEGAMLSFSPALR